MHLFLLPLLVLLTLGKTGRGLDGQQAFSSFAFLNESHRRQLPSVNHEETEDKPDLFVAVPHLTATGLVSEGQRQREKMLSRVGRLWKKPRRPLHPSRDVESEHDPLRTQILTPPTDGKKVGKPPLQEEARKFWHHFMSRKGMVSQGVILPIKSHEVNQETCRTVPFSQTVTHEDCEEVVVPNNLCFGKCGSIHFPGTAAHPHSFCPHCLPTKFTTTHLRLNCTSLTPVVKVVLQVEECQCTAKAEHGEGHLLQAGSQDSFIPGIST